MANQATGIVTLALALLGSPGLAEAQTKPAATASPSKPEDVQLDEILVTAQRRTERLQDVPIAISAISGDKIGSGVVNTAEDFARQVVGLQFDRVFQASNPTIFLRGVGVNDYNPASSGAVGVTSDEVFLNSGVGQLSSVYDIDRVEVLRGPQGTLYGRNTTGGILNFYTRQPSFDPRVDASATYGSFNQRYLDVGVGGPIVSDVVAARAAVSVRQRDGWVRNTLDGRRLNDIDSLFGRFQLLVRPADGLTVDAKIEGGRSRTSAYRAKAGGTFNAAAGRACTGEEVLALGICSNPLSGFTDSKDLNSASVNVLDNAESLDSISGRLAISWEGAGVSVKAISAYNRNARKLNQDQDSSPAALLESPIWNERAKQFTQEIRVSGANDTLKWIVGGFYLRENLESRTDFELLRQFSPNLNAPFFSPANSILTIRRDYTQITSSKALFAQFDYKVSSALTATFGLRYTWDRKRLKFITVAGPVGEPGAGLITPLIGLLDSNPVSFAIDPPIQTNDSFNKPTWRFALDYKPSADTLMYASYNRGFRSGGRNTGALTAPIEFASVRPEKIDAFELGYKVDVLNRKLRINGAAFYYSYKDLQVFTLEPGTPVPYQRLQNANAEIYGAELELVARPIQGLDLTGGVALLHTRYTKLNDALRGNLSGKRLDKAPSIQLSGSARYETSVSSDWSAHIGSDISYQSKIFFSPTNVSPLVRTAYALVNAEIGADHQSNGFGLSVFVKNLTDHRYLQDVSDVSSFGNYLLFYNEPRTFGVTLHYNM
jgi:iron complex outermembrane recepter protein